ncbi:hypothetical protein N7U66_04330 [Lacinutrix neustonica]|uniref:Uncharacterized protein n=1 Tax=Lacinutrix neustonica TaxID=2980107 RepID=A0A9E8SEM2_9FLAO|nr:hypothetical protein [Lacinutrix neustonica]WAC02867.1 hypothetical protein N7U66_04330 [Lacinutrix neustonica]
MNQNFQLKLNFGLLLITVICCFTNCEKDYLEQESLKTITPSKFRIKTLNKKDVEANVLLADKILKLNSKSDASTIQNKEIYNTDYSFTIDTDQVKHIENVATGYHSYTFGIIRDTITNNKVENLLLSLNADNEYNAYIVQYGFSKAEYLNSDSTLLNSSTTTYIPIDFDFSVFADGELAKDYRMPELQCDFHWETSTVDDNEGQLVGETSSSSQTVLVASNCQYVSSGGSGAPGNEDDDYSNTGTTDSEGTSVREAVLAVLTPRAPIQIRNLKKTLVKTLNVRK